jgi:hypothetical protein
MKFMYSTLAAVSMMAFMQMDAKRDPIDRDKIPGTYISEYFETRSSSGALVDIRSELLTLHADGTAERYISTSIGSSLASQNNNGIELTPSLGTWEVDYKHNTVKAVFFDWFNFAPCDTASTCDISCLNDCPPADQVISYEYDRITYTIRFADIKDCKYQRACANELLWGILISTCQNNANPLDFSGAGCTNLATYNSPFLALKSTKYLENNNLIDPTADALSRNNIIFHRVNTQENFVYPSAPSCK